MPDNARVYVTYLPDTRSKRADSRPQSKDVDEKYYVKHQYWSNLRQLNALERFAFNDDRTADEIYSRKLLNKRVIMLFAESDRTTLIDAQQAIDQYPLDASFFSKLDHSASNRCASFGPFNPSFDSNHCIGTLRRIS